MHFSTWLQSASCSENSAIAHEITGQTLNALLNPLRSQMNSDPLGSFCPFARHGHNDTSVRWPGQVSGPFRDQLRPLLQQITAHLARPRYDLFEEARIFCPAMPPRWVLDGVAHGDLTIGQAVALNVFAHEHLRLGHPHPHGKPKHHHDQRRLFRQQTRPFCPRLLPCCSAGPSPHRPPH